MHPTSNISGQWIGYTVQVNGNVLKQLLPDENDDLYWQIVFGTVSYTFTDEELDEILKDMGFVAKYLLRGKQNEKANIHPSNPMFNVARLPGNRKIRSRLRRFRPKRRRKSDTEGRGSVDGES